MYTDPSGNAMLQLYIGNKNYSSWSLRPWLAMRQLGIAFEERWVRFDGFGADSQFKRTLSTLTPAGTVPVLVDDGLAVWNPLAVWDSLSIAEYLAEKFPEAGIWPEDTSQRAHARSVCAEMHAGFGALRTHCPMNIEASLPEVGQKVWTEQPAVRADVQYLCAMWSRLLEQYSGPMLFGSFCMADAYFAPVCMRLHAYALPVPHIVRDYIERVRNLPAMQEWIASAQAERDFRDFEEPYRSQP